LELVLLLERERQRPLYTKPRATMMSLEQWRLSQLNEKA